MSSPTRVGTMVMDPRSQPPLRLLYVGTCLCPESPQIEQKVAVSILKARFAQYNRMAVPVRGVLDLFIREVNVWLESRKKGAYPYGSDYGKPGWSVKDKYGGLQKASISEICNVSGGSAEWTELCPLPIITDCSPKTYSCLMRISTVKELL
jgi:hypothetical protein